MKNKKGLSSFALLIAGFGVVCVMFLFLWLLVFNTGTEYLIGNTADIGRNILANNTNIAAAQGTTTITNLENEINNIAWPFDLFFLFAFISGFTATIYSAWQAPKIGIFSFLGFVFIGSMMLLLVTAFTSNFATWAMANLIEGVFTANSYSVPMLSYYIQNMAIVNLIWWAILVLVAAINRNYVSQAGVVEE